MYSSLSVYRTIILAFIFFLSSYNSLHSNNIEALDQKKVLYLNSYHKGYLWSDKITEGIEKTLLGKINELHIEYLDTKHQFDETYQQALAELIRIKHNKHNFDILIVSDDNAFNYAIMHRSDLFADIPIVFCGVNYFNPKSIENIYDVTGVSEVTHMEKSLNLIKQLHPQCKKVVIITDNTTTGKQIQKKIHEDIVELKSIVPEIEIIFDISEQDLTHRLRKLPQDNILLYTFFFQDRNGKFLEFNEGAQLVCENSSVPVYGCWDFSMGFGIVGGHLAQGYDQGVRSAEMALDILGGKDINEMQVIETPLVKLQFDYRELKRHNISQKNLPEGNEILYFPTNFYQTYKKLIYQIFIIIGVLIFFIVILSLALRKTYRLKREIEKGQKRLSSLISNIPDVVYRYQNQNGWTVSYISKNVEELTGYNEDHFLNQGMTKFTDIIHPEDIEGVSNAIEQAIRKDSSWKINYRIIHNDGNIRWIDEAGRSIKNDRGESIFIDGIYSDITDQKKAEIKIIESEERYKNLSRELDTIIDHISGLVFYKDDNNNYLYVNKYLADGFNIPKHEFRNKNAFDLYPEKLAKQYHKDDLEVIQNQKAKLDIEEPWKNSKGERLLLTSKIPYINEREGIRGVIGIGIDITERKKIENQLKEKNKEYEILNQELTDRNSLLRKAEKELTAHRSNLENLVKERTAEIEDLNAQLIDSNNELKTTNDLLLNQKTELETLLRELSQAQQQLVHSEKMASVGVLTAGIAHEINNPINFISSGLVGLEVAMNNLIETIDTNAVATENELGEKNYRQALKNIPRLIDAMRSGINRTTEILKGLRTFSRMENEQKSKADIHEIIESALVILKNQYRNKIKLIRNYGDLPPTLCFPGKLGQVILNILINAIQAIEDRGMIEIVTSYTKDSKIKITIVDNGKGIPKDIQHKIFDPFYTTKEVGEGTGLGLSIAHSIMEEHQGTISFKTKEKKGTIFTIEFPKS